MPNAPRKFKGKGQAARATAPPDGESLRGNSTERGYCSRWQRARLIYLKQHPLCVKCKGAGYTKEATVVDHVTPHRGNQDLFWDISNWQALCDACHNSKTGKGQ